MIRISQLFLCLTALLAVSCRKDDITVLSSDASSFQVDSTPIDVPSADEDDIANTEFDRTIMISWTNEGASVTRGDENGIVSINGGHVTVDNTPYKEKVCYVLSGTSSDGSFKVYSNNKQAFQLERLSLTNPAGAVINNQGKKRCFVVVGSGESVLSDASSAEYATTGTEDMKAVFFSEGQLIFSGSGILRINANNAKGKSALTSDDYICVAEDGPTVKVSSGASAGHGIRGKDYILLSGGNVEATVAGAMKKGFSSDSLVVITGGSALINVSGGTAYDEDDQDYSGSAGIKADYGFKMTGGVVDITNTGKGGKGIRVGGSAEKGKYIHTSEVSGGRLTVKVTGANDTSNDVSAKGIKVGWAVKSGTKAPPTPPGGGGGNPGGMGGESHTYSAMTGDFVVSGGIVQVTCASSEAVEIKKTFTISGGEFFAYSTGDDAANSVSTFTITGGKVCGISTANDGLDANGNFYIKGGIVYASGKSSPELAIDANTEGGFKLYIEGGTVVALGGVESGASISLNRKTGSWSPNSWYGVSAGSTSFAFKTPGSGGSGMYCFGSSTPVVASGVTPGAYIWSGYGSTSY